MIVVLALVYCHMVKVLGSCFSSAMSEEKKRIQILFGVFILSYIALAGYSFGLGYYKYKLICQV